MGRYGIGGKKRIEVFIDKEFDEKGVFKGYVVKRKEKPQDKLSPPFTSFEDAEQWIVENGYATVLGL